MKAASEPPRHPRDEELALLFFRFYRADQPSFRVPRGEWWCGDKPTSRGSLPGLVTLFRRQRVMPEIVRAYALYGQTWEITDDDSEHLSFTMVPRSLFIPEPQPLVLLADLSVPDEDNLVRPCEQTLLKNLETNRIVDLFLGARMNNACDHKRYFCAEFDALYRGQDPQGRKLFVPVEAKRNGEHLNSVQMLRYFDACDQMEAHDNIVRVLGVHHDEYANRIAVFEFERIRNQVHVKREAHYRLTRAKLPSDKNAQALSTP